MNSNQRVKNGRGIFQLPASNEGHVNTAEGIVSFVAVNKPSFDYSDYSLLCSYTWHLPIYFLIFQNVPVCVQEIQGTVYNQAHL